MGSNPSLGTINKEGNIMQYMWTGWKLLKFNVNGEVFYKVFATFYREEWRLNSGISSFEDLRPEENVIMFTGTSGSVYLCPADAEGKTHYSWEHVYREFLEHPEVSEISFEDFKKEFINA